MEDHCEVCGYDARGVSAAEVIAQLRTTPSWFRHAAAQRDDAQLRAQPARGVWSPLEYLIHVRDLMAYHRWLIEEALTHEHPTIPVSDPDAVIAAMDLTAVDLATLLDQLERRVDRLVEMVQTFGPTDYARPLALTPEPGDIDVALVLRSALHEAVHHRQDLARLAVANRKRAT